jgi:hypothetical protein
MDQNERLRAAVEARYVEGLDGIQARGGGARGGGLYASMAVCLEALDV